MCLAEGVGKLFHMGDSGSGSIGAFTNFDHARLETIRMSGVSCRLGRLRGIVVDEAGIPFLEERPEHAVERPCSDPQQRGARRASSIASAGGLPG
jgi:hypothetical protein